MKTFIYIDAKESYRFTQLLLMLYYFNWIWLQQG